MKLTKMLLSHEIKITNQVRVILALMYSGSIALIVSGMGSSAYSNLVVPMILSLIAEIFGIFVLFQLYRLIRRTSSVKKLASSLLLAETSLVFLYGSAWLAVFVIYTVGCKGCSE